MVTQTALQADLLQEMGRLAPSSQASTLLRVAVNVLGIRDETSAGHRDEILRVCRVFAGEGKLVLEMAEEIACELAAR